jgi:hypothetical protein
MNKEIKLTIEEISTAIQGSESVIERIDYLKEILEERRKHLEDEHMGCEEEYAIKDVMNLLDLVKNRSEEGYDQEISTFFRGDTTEVSEFISEFRLLLGRHVSIDYGKSKKHMSHFDDSWLISAVVSDNEIKKFNLEMDWMI